MWFTSSRRKRRSFDTRRLEGRGGAQPPAARSAATATATIELMKRRAIDAVIIVIGVVMFAGLSTVVRPRESAGTGARAEIGGPKARNGVAVASVADARRLRERLQQLVWGRPGVPRDVEARLEPLTRPQLSNLRGVRRTRRLVIPLPRGFHSLGVLSESQRQPARGLVIWHGSHSRQPVDADVVGSFAAAGFDIASLSMPLYGDNQSKFVRDEAGIRIRPRTHHDLMRVERPLRFFMDPVAGVVNALAQNYQFVALGGFSGGGWTTNVYGALDTRLDAVYPVAASLPLDMRSEPRDVGDDEQRYPPLFSLASYEDLYVLGSARRRQFAIWNRFDSCCFAGGRERQFASAVEAASRQLDGTYETHSDASHRRHVVSPRARQMILRDMQIGARGPR